MKQGFSFFRGIRYYMIYLHRRRFFALRPKSNLVNKVAKKAFKTLFNVGSHLPKNHNLIMFESFNGRQFSDNPRAIYEYLQTHHPSYKMIWSVDRRHTKQFEGKNIDYVVRFTPKWLYLMTRAKFWVTNSRFPLWFKKSENTVYLQTWHGTPLKRLGLDMDEVHMPGTNTEKYKKNFASESAKWNYLISPNAYSTEIFKRAFGYHNDVIESGYPRNDVLVQQNNPQAIAAIKERLKLPADKKIILYAPTWRDNEFYSKGRYKFKLQFDMEKMKAELGDEYIILLRMHYLVAENLDLSGYEDFFYDYSAYEDIRDLYLLSDLLITDYSSVFFDYSILNRPMLFYVYDIDNYRDTLRGFYFDFEQTAPGPLVKTTEELIEEIKKAESDEATSTHLYQAFTEKFVSLEDGNATERVVNEVFINR